MGWTKSECIDPRCDWPNSLDKAALYRKQKGHLQMTQRARKGKLYQLQNLLDLSCFIISHILVFDCPTTFDSTILIYFTIVSSDNLV